MVSKEQKEGLARVFDTLAASTIIAIVVGLAGYGAMDGRDIVLLCALCPIILASAWRLRRPST